MASNIKSTLSGDMMRALEKIQKLTRRRSTTVTMLNKNPSVSTRAMGNTQSKSDTVLDPDIDRLQKLCARFLFTCRECKAPLELDIQAHIESWQTGSQSIPPKSHFSSIKCPSDKCHSSCAGCGKEPSSNSQNIFTSLGVINYCCELGRLFSIWFLLARFDEAQQTTSISKAVGTKVKKNKLSDAPGVGYATSYSDYMDLDFYDYGGMDPWAGGRKQLPSQDPIFEDKKQAQDKLMIETLKLLTPLLPKHSAQALEELCMFRLSMLLDRITELIRNDSVTEITNRSELFSEVLKFAHAVADRPALHGLLCTERFVKKNHPGLRQLGIPKSPLAFVIDDSPGNRASSFFENSTDTYRQVKAFLQLADRQKDRPDSSNELANEKSKEVAKICRSMVELHGNLGMKITNILNIPEVVVSVEDPWNTFLEENQITFTDDVLKGHRYEKEIIALKSSRSGRMNSISKEIAILTTSLPTGIFLKIAESRSDALRVLIVGPGGTPYEGGLFIFDMFLDAEYPITPPKMAFVLWGNDSEAHSFNPNLHRGGGVCLSILNTWSGAAAEMWQPNKSTILAVLISVQAMILGAPVPWINEPGYESQGHSKSAQIHKLLMQVKTTRYAMIGWLQKDFANPSAPEYVWKDISQMYWKHNGAQVAKTIREWAKENVELRNYVDTPDQSAKKVKKPKKVKGAATPSSEAASAPEPVKVDFLKMLEGLLGIKTETKIEGIINRIKGKRKASELDPNPGIPSHPKKQKSATPSMATKWVYTGAITQKETRAACKDFGIGAKSTIKDTITRIESHVNEKGKANPALVEKWGKTVEMDDDTELEGMTTSSSEENSGSSSSSALSSLGPLPPSPGSFSKSYAAKLKKDKKSSH